MTGIPYGKQLFAQFQLQDMCVLHSILNCELNYTI